MKVPKYQTQLHNNDDDNLKNHGKITLSQQITQKPSH